MISSDNFQLHRTTRSAKYQPVDSRGSCRSWNQQRFLRNESIKKDAAFRETEYRSEQKTTHLQRSGVINEIKHYSINIDESYSPSIASFSYLVTFDVLKTPLMLRAVKVDKQNEWCT
jgi:hypothetical protein